MQISLSFGFRLGRSTVSKIIHETCSALWEALSPTVLALPNSVDDWMKISLGFENMWNLPHCLGALDGKHVIIDCPAKSGSKFFNYKGTFSVILMGLCDSNYRFTMVDIGNYGSQSDGGVFSRSHFGIKLKNKNLNLPQQSRMPNSEISLPYFFIGDEAFPLMENLMRPYPGRYLNFQKKIYNYRLSRARRIIENSFGIMAARWRIFRRPIKGSPENIDNIIKACIVLHNFLLSDEVGQPVHRRKYNPPAFADTEDSDGNIVEGEWRNEVIGEEVVQDIDTPGPNRPKKRAGDVRDLLAKYLTTDGKVPWQNAYVLRS